MSDEQDKLKLKIEQAEAAVARAQQVYDAAEPGSVRDSCLQLLLANKASLLALHSGASEGEGVTATACSSRCDNCCQIFWDHKVYQRSPCSLEAFAADLQQTCHQLLAACRWQLLCMLYTGSLHSIVAEVQTKLKCRLVAL